MLYGTFLLTQKESKKEAWNGSQEKWTLTHLDHYRPAL